MPRETSYEMSYRLGIDTAVLGAKVLDMNTTQLTKFAANITDSNLLGLLVRMQEKGRKAERDGDSADVAKFQEAWNVYRTEATRRGLA